MLGAWLAANAETHGIAQSSYSCWKRPLQNPISSYRPIHQRHDNDNRDNRVLQNPIESRFKDITQCKIKKFAEPIHNWRPLLRIALGGYKPLNDNRTQRSRKAKNHLPSRPHIL